MLEELTLCPIARSVVASLSWLLETHRNGRIGSPIVAGSSNRSKSTSSIGYPSSPTEGCPRPCVAPFARASRGPASPSGRVRSYFGRASLRARLRRSRRSPPPSPPRPRSIAGLARQARNEQLHTGCGGVIRRSSKRYRRWPRRQESRKQSKSVQLKTRFNCFWASPDATDRTRGADAPRPRSCSVISRGRRRSIA